MECSVVFVVMDYGNFGRLPFCANIHIGFECRGFVFSFFFWVCVLARVLVLEE